MSEAAKDISRGPLNLDAILNYRGMVMAASRSIYRSEGFEGLRGNRGQQLESATSRLLAQAQSIIPDSSQYIKKVEEAEKKGTITRQEAEALKKIDSHNQIPHESIYGEKGSGEEWADQATVEMGRRIWEKVKQFERVI